MLTIFTPEWNIYIYISAIIDSNILETLLINNLYKLGKIKDLG